MNGILLVWSTLGFEIKWDLIIFKEILTQYSAVGGLSKRFTGL